MRRVSPAWLVRLAGIPAVRYCARVEVSPERARSKILAARSSAAGGRELGSVGGVVSVGAAVSVEEDVVAGCDAVESISVGCCCDGEEEGDVGRAIGMGMLVKVLAEVLLVIIDDVRKRE